MGDLTKKITIEQVELTVYWPLLQEQSTNFTQVLHLACENSREMSSVALRGVFLKSEKKNLW